MNSTKSWKTPTAEQVTRAIALLGQAAQARYFFDRLTNPEWIQPLRDSGLFRKPPPAQTNEDKGTISFPPWPPSRYLARMASERPELVRDVILQMDRTDNVSVHEDIIEAALRMPANIAAPLAKRNIEEISRFYMPLPEKLATLMLHLAKGGEHHLALRLARHLLEPIRAETPPATIEGRDELRLSADAEPKIPDWEYQEIIQECYPSFVAHIGIPAFQLICDLLQEAIGITRGKRQEPPEDYSSIWRPAIEEHSQNVSSDLENLLVSGVRNTAEQLARERPGYLRELMRLLEQRPSHVFRRISLHLLRTFSDFEDAREAIAARLTNKGLFEASWACHEFVLLESMMFGSLSPEQQATILGWIEQGPDLEAFKRSHEEWTGKAPSDADAEKYRKVWQRDRLAPIQDRLPRDWRELYARLVAEVGEPEHPEFSSYSFSYVGPTGPVTVEQLSAMPMDAIVEFLRTWRPPKEHFAPTPEGLARNLSSVAQADPARFAQAADEFRSVDPTYVRALFRGWADATAENKQFDWGPVLSLAAWVAEQPVLKHDCDPRPLHSDPGWGWSRKAIAGLLTIGFRNQAIPLKEREHAWLVLKPLTEDPDPTPEEDSSTGMDPATLSINTTRGEAMHAVVQYGLWLHRHFKAGGQEARLRAGFGSMPEVREVLDRRLQTDVEPTRAVRAVYGQWFPWLTLLDKQWAQDHAAKIFLSPSVSEALWRAAWGTYVVFCSPYTSVFDFLKEQYSIAVERLGVDTNERDGLRDPDRRLAEHLVIYYGRGHLLLDDPLIVRFWDKAAPKVAAHALSYGGRSLREEKTTPDPAVIARFKALWEWRLAVVSAAKAERTAEAAAFGWWFVSGKFDDLWAITNLVKAIELARRIDFDSRVLERLAATAAGLPQQALAAIIALLEESEPWKIHAWRESIRTITSIGLRSGDPIAKRRAEELINALGQRGYFDFRDLLRQAQ